MVQPKEEEEEAFTSERGFNDRGVNETLPSI